MTYIWVGVGIWFVLLVAVMIGLWNATRVRGGWRTIREWKSTPILVSNKIDVWPGGKIILMGQTSMWLADEYMHTEDPLRVRVVVETPKGGARYMPAVLVGISFLMQGDTVQWTAQDFDSWKENHVVAA